MSECDCTDRRRFLRFAGLSVVVSAIDPTFLRAAADPRLERIRGVSASGKTLVYVFMRGGTDGLNLMVPTESSEYALYRSYRPTIALDRNHPDFRQMNSDFGLHPLLRDGLSSLWLDGNVAAFPDVGYPNGSRSHFDSMSYIDSGTPHSKAVPGGWLNRWLQAAPPSPDPLRALAFASLMPPPLIGAAPAVSVADLSELKVTSDLLRNQQVVDAEEVSYGQPVGSRPNDAELKAAGEALVGAIRAVTPALPAPTVAYPAGVFARSLSQLSQLLRSGLFAIEVAEIDLGGWDHHANQTYRYDLLIRELSDGLTAFVRDLGPTRMQDVLVLTTSEFGRSARENGSLGTDHGSGWPSFAIGGAVRGGVYHGAGGWRGLSNLRDGRDLEHSLDFRDLYSEILLNHLGLLPPTVFPGWTATPVGFL